MVDYEKELELFREHAKAFHQMEPEPELKLTPRGDPDPRPLRLVKLLAKQAAREHFESEVKAGKERLSKLK